MPHNELGYQRVGIPQLIFSMKDKESIPVMRTTNSDSSDSNEVVYGTLNSKVIYRTAEVSDYQEGVKGFE